MAFVTGKLFCIGNSGESNLFSYIPKNADVIATIKANAYFDGAADTLKVGDIIIVGVSCYDVLAVAGGVSMFYVTRVRTSVDATVDGGKSGVTARGL